MTIMKSANGDGGERINNQPAEDVGHKICRRRASRGVTVWLDAHWGRDTGELRRPRRKTVGGLLGGYLGEELLLRQSPLNS